METSLYVTGNSDFSDRLSVNGDVSLNSKLNVVDEATFVNHIHANKDININENLNVIGDISFGGQLTVHDISLFKQNVVMKDNMDLSNNLTVHGSSLFEDDVTIGTTTSTTTPTTTNFYNNKIILKDTVIENTNNLYINDISTSGVTNNLNYNIVTEKIYITDTLHASKLTYDELLSTGISRHTFNKIFLEDYTDASGEVLDSGIIKIDCEMSANRKSTFLNNIKIGLDTDSLESTTFTLHATQDDTTNQGVTYDGNITVGVPNTTSNNRKLTVYGDLVIKDGGNIIIEDVSNTTITQLQTEVKVTDILEIHNDGSGPALTVNQIYSFNQDIVHFQDDSANVFTIGSLGKTYIAGNVGIGIKNTSYKLQVESTDGILIPRGTTEQRPYVTSGLMRYNLTTHQFEGYSKDTWVNFVGLTDIDSDTYITAEKTTDDDTLRFYTTSSERMKIDQMGNFTINTNMLYLDNSNNNIGLFTTTPKYAIDISSDNALLLPVGDKSTRPSNVTAGLIRYNTETTQFEGYSSGAWQGLGGVVDTDQDTYITAEKNSDEDKLRFVTNGNERMNIDSSGTINVYEPVKMNNNSITDISSVTINGILTSTNEAYITKLGIHTTSPSEVLDVNGNVHVGGILVSDSDMKLKDNITKLTSTLDTIDGLNGYKYTRKDLDQDKYHIGVIAQEVELLYPELVSHNVSTDIKSVNYGGISAVLIECVKHLKHQNQELYDKNQELEKRMSKLEGIINNLVKK